METTAWILPSEWPGRLPPARRVNVPEFVTSLYPGQKIALAVGAQGPQGDALLDGVGIRVTFSTAARGVVVEKVFKAETTRAIKAEGADAAMAALAAGGISGKDMAELEKAVAGVTIAVFQPEWSAPMVDHDEDVTISVVVIGKESETALRPSTIRIRQTSDWLSEPPGTLEKVGAYMNRYHGDLSPGRMLAMLRTFADGDRVDNPPIFGFFALGYAGRKDAREAAIAAFPSLDAKTQMALAVVLRMGGQDVSSLLPRLTPESASAVKGLGRLKDPRTQLTFQDPITLETARRLGGTMDECWGGWMATGDSTYLRALVGLLAGEPDYPEFKAWQKARGGAEGINDHIVRGLAYQIAGWSIGAFERADPLVADWILYWENDPTFPPQLRKELGTLLGNPNFRQK